MSLSREQVIQIAELAKLALTEEEIDRYAGQLSAILDYAARLEQLNTAEIPPTASVLPLNSVMRDDVVRPSLPPSQVVSNAPDAIENQFRVSAVLNE